MSAVNSVFSAPDFVSQIICHLDAAGLLAVERVCWVFKEQSLAAIEVWKQIAQNMGVAGFKTPAYSYRAIVLDSFQAYCLEAIKIPAQEIKSLEKQDNPALWQEAVKNALQKLPKEAITEYSKQWISLQKGAVTALTAFQITRVWKDLNFVARFPPRDFIDRYLRHNDADLLLDNFFEAEKQLGTPQKTLGQYVLIALRTAFLRAFESNQFHLPAKMSEWIQTLSVDEFDQVLSFIAVNTVLRFTSYRNAPLRTNFLFHSQIEINQAKNIVVNYLRLLRDPKLTPLHKGAKFESSILTLPNFKEFFCQGITFDGLTETNDDPLFMRLWLLAFTRDSVLDSPDHLYFSDIAKVHNDQCIMSDAKLLRYQDVGPSSRLLFTKLENYSFNMLNFLLHQAIVSKTENDVRENGFVSTLLQKAVEESNMEGALIYLTTYQSQYTISNEIVYRFLLRSEKSAIEHQSRLRDIEGYLVKALDRPSAALVIYFLKSQLREPLKLSQFQPEFEGHKFTLGKDFEHLVNKMSDIDFKILTTWLPFFSYDFLCSPQEGVPHSFVVFDPTNEVLHGKKMVLNLTWELNELLTTYLKSLRST